ncbi:hypothetical protein MKW94_016559 [Papaver nudicaule]|uniref:Uncharacterized protein n=1 Tax=Papaver nudicaule TaxID=74823 RepID=A0AA41RXY2_PAPNU|nr:hypothetical protein [Papaver nudicaule]
MAKFCSLLVTNIVFLLLLIVLAVSAATDKGNAFGSVLPSLDVASLTETNICDPKDVYKDTTWGPTKDCNVCLYYCTGVCVNNPTYVVCQDGDTESETTLITSNCADCTNWCKEECADLGATVVNDKCAIGESKFAGRCKCCCRESSCAGCPADVTWTIPGLSPCKYKLSLSLLSSSMSM